MDNYAIAKKFYTALFPPCMVYKRLHRSTSLRKHCASLWSKVNQCKAFRLKPTSGMVSVLDLTIPSLLRERYLFTCSPMAMIMWPFWFVPVLDVYKRCTETSNLVYRLTIACLTLPIKNLPWKGVVRVRWSVLEFLHPVYVNVNVNQKFLTWLE